MMCLRINEAYGEKRGLKTKTMRSQKQENKCVNSVCREARRSYEVEDEKKLIVFPSRSRFFSSYYGQHLVSLHPKNCSHPSLPI